MHGYKNPNLAAEKNKQVGTARKSAATAEPKDHHEFWVECMGKLAAKPLMPYKISTCYKMNDVVDHKIFGKGFVSRVVDFEKIEVIFEQGVKLLVHGKS